MATSRPEASGLTLSTEQLAVCRRRAQAAEIAERCRFELRDYRAVEGRFDRICENASNNDPALNFMQRIASVA